MSAEQNRHETIRELERLIREIQKYLAAFDEFRRQGREPHWRPENVVYAVAPRR